MLVVNVDIAFLVNFVTNFAWLCSTAVLAGVRPRRWRLPLASAAGAAAAVWAYFPTGRWLTSAPGALAGSAALLLLAFCPCRVQQAMRAAAYFILSGGAMAGIAVLTSARQAGPEGAYRFPAMFVAPGIMLTLAGGRYLWEAVRERRQLARGLYRLQVQVGDRSVELPALLDTGNSLRDPLSGAPVTVVEAAALSALLPPAVLQAATRGWEGFDGLPGSWAARCKMVPFRAVGRPAGILLAFAPDRLRVMAPDGQDWTEATGLLGLSAERLHPEEAYRALLAPRTIESGAEVPGSA